jgi:hypothetical protein
MPLPSSGPLSLNDIQTEFGGTNPIGMNEYYAGGGLVPAGTTGTFGAVPSSGALSVQNFYGTANYIPVYIEELFSTWLETGGGTSFTINNGIDLSTKGGMAWMKRRSSAQDNYVFDTVRGANNALITNDTIGQYSNSQINSFTTTGFTGSFLANASTNVFWTFREQPKFFDIVTYTGNGANRNIAHNLGSVPGCIIIKRTNASDNWVVYHRSLGNDYQLFLNLTLAQNYTNEFNFTTPTSTVFSVNGNDAVNASGGTYVAYLFAHNAGGFGLTGTDNVISCGSFTTDSSGNATVNLGYEPQWLLSKITNVANSWDIVDVMRSWPVGPTNDAFLYPNNSNAEFSSATKGEPTATGFNITAGGNTLTYIYIAIRRGPMKVPTTGTSVYQPVTYTGTSANQTITAGFPVDLSIIGNRSVGTIGQFAIDRLRGATRTLNTTTTQAEFSDTTGLTSFASNTAITLGSSGNGYVNDSGRTYIDWNFRRAPSFFDEVCYTGTGVARTVAHNLTVVPELMIVKSRTSGASWLVGSTYLATTDVLFLALDLPVSGGNPAVWNSAYPTASVINLGDNPSVNASGGNFVAYLFATCPGVSKVGSFTGTGATQVINCGFTGGARFVLIKSTSTSGDWYVWDSARGIVAGNDPYLRLNSDAAEVTNTDWVDTAASGFELSNAGGNLANSNGVSYIFLAVS